MQERFLLWRLSARRIIKHLKNDKNIPVFIVMLLLSSFFWFLTSLGKTQLSEISYKIKYENFPSDKVLINDIPKEIKLSIKAKGSILLTDIVNIRSKQIILNFKDIKEDFKLTDDGVFEKNISTQFFNKSIKSQLNSSSELIDIKPKFIDFKFHNKLAKKLKVNHNINLSFANQYILKEQVKLTPDSIEVEGSELYLKNVSTIECKPSELKKMDKNASLDLEVNFDSNLKYSYSKKIKAEILVEKFTETTLVLPLQVENKPDSLNINLFPNKVTVVLNIGLSKYSILTSNSFKAVVDFNTINSDPVVQLREMPSYVKIKSIYPEKIDYLIEQFN